MLVPFITIVLGVVGRKSWPYWFYAVLASFWFEIIGSVFDDWSTQPGLIGGLFHKYYGNQPIEIVYSIFLLIAVYGGSIWLTRKGWKFQPNQSNSFFRTRKVKIWTSILWIFLIIYLGSGIFGLVNAMR